MTTNTSTVLNGDGAARPQFTEMTTIPVVMSQDHSPIHIPARELAQHCQRNGKTSFRWDCENDESVVVTAIANCVYQADYAGQSTQIELPPLTITQALRLNPYRGTDQGNADLFLAKYQSELIYSPDLGEWFHYSNGTWQQDKSLTIPKMSATISADIHELIADFPQEHPDYEADKELNRKYRELTELALALESNKKRAAMLDAARLSVTVPANKLDQDHTLLNCSNGTVDLKTGQLRPHNRRDFITQNTGIQFNPNATAPAWEQFLLDVFCGDRELIDYIRRAVGYSLTGDTKEQVMFIAHGSGSNGKSVFFNIIKKLLGGLVVNSPANLLMSGSGDRVPIEQADLFGRRVAICQETESTGKLAESTVKRLTGSDPITARRLYKDYWEFLPTHKIWLGTNHKPEIKGTDHAIWRRINLIPFNATFSDSTNPKKNPEMETILTNELPGILNWAIQGCLEWQQSGLNAPAIVLNATQDYRMEMDTLGTFLDQCCVVNARADCKASDLYKVYCDWCDNSGEYALSQRKFGLKLTERGINKQRLMNGFHYQGIGILATDSIASPIHEPYEPYEPLHEPLHEPLKQATARVYEPYEPYEPSLESFPQKDDCEVITVNNSADSEFLGKFPKEGSYRSYRSCAGLESQQPCGSVSHEPSMHEGSCVVHECSCNVHAAESVSLSDNWEEF